MVNIDTGLQDIRKVLWAVTALAFVGLGWYWLCVVPFLAWAHLSVKKYMNRKTPNAV